MKTKTKLQSSGEGERRVSGVCHDLFAVINLPMMSYKREIPEYVSGDM